MLSPRRRYGSKTAALRHIFSEYGLIRFRVLVECRWLQQLAGIPEIKEVPAFSKEAQAALAQLADSFDVNDAAAVKKVSHRFGQRSAFTCWCPCGQSLIATLQVESITAHDVKAIEYIIKDRNKDNAALAKVSDASSNCQLALTQAEVSFQRQFV